MILQVAGGKSPTVSMAKGGGLVVHDRYINGVTDGGETTPVNGLINR